jgi:hypothetical protein
MKRSVKRCYLKQACFANDSAGPVVRSSEPPSSLSTKGFPFQYGLCQIANSLFEIGLKFYPDVGRFLADPISIWNVTQEMPPSTSFT